jgi:hypothetical protein
VALSGGRSLSLNVLREKASETRKSLCRESVFLKKQKTGTREKEAANSSFFLVMVEYQRWKHLLFMIGSRDRLTFRVDVFR